MADQQNNQEKNNNERSGKSRGRRSRNDSRGRRRGGKGGANRRYYSECPICNQGVRDILTAIAWGEERKPAHFDCILKNISESEELTPKEKLVYLGGGSFGIVQFRSGGGPGPRFTVRKRIQLEEKEEKIEWRRKISRKIR